MCILCEYYLYWIYMRYESPNHCHNVRCTPLRLMYCKGLPRRLLPWKWADNDFSGNDNWLSQYKWLVQVTCAFQFHYYTQTYSNQMQINQESSSRTEFFFIYHDCGCVWKQFLSTSMTGSNPIQRAEMKGKLNIHPPGTTKSAMCLSRNKLHYHTN